MSRLDPDDEETTGMIRDLERMCTKLERKTSSNSTFIHLLEAQISPKGLEWKQDGQAPSRAREQGMLEAPNGFLTLESTRALTSLILEHVSQSTEAGCRMLIDVILLHLAAAVSDENEAVSIVPEYAILKTVFNEKHSFGGVVDYLVTKLPSAFTRQILGQPVATLNRPDLKHIGTSNVFEAKNLVEIHDYTRGAIANGKTWLFFIYRKLQVGGTYAASPPVELSTGAENLLLILGLLRDWILNASRPEIAYFDEV
ncbi:uncharacterized protein STEHIDRAFT_155237 [Stereum hirsutum FP-91666 SS1]|uniref:uncharacterized protein n=1 Tax=Stereum hirsutum (strain FP-91666) TaxID=721885 RepID=UPI000440D7CC|nr:uncharacterized protein STEHIDRAFT_155237 [Stereum hirsutum FP-91666 SS1]EIM87874.1 hypothetical protein STEHIDRAFT_155237 [Stereum hirsutum FP-91666 SS1]